MCGIAGYAGTAASLDEIGPKRRSDALDALRHRGPDASGQYRNGGVWFGHTRLSIIDLSSAGNQPMQTADGRFAITYNGETYNYRGLAKQHALGSLQSTSDTEVVLRLFEKHGTACFRMLNGMFAFAIHDTRAGKIWLVRDRLGIKPLYYQAQTDRVLFASEIKGIKALDPSPSSVDARGLHEWLYYGNPLGETTLQENIKQLLPGHYLEVDLATLTSSVRRYWSLEEQATEKSRPPFSDSALAAKTGELLEQAVRRQLVSDVPVGVFLSGGIDSSAIVAFASRHYSGRLATYSAGFDFASNGGELPKAKRIASRYGTDHHEIHIEGGAVADLVEKLVMHHDMPFADAANIPLYLLAAEINQSTKVILQGDGGDELFGGYRRYSTLNYYATMSVLARLAGRLVPLFPESALRYRVQRYVNAFAAADLCGSMARLLTVEDPSQAPTAVFSKPLRAKTEASNPFARFEECLAMFQQQDIGSQMSLVDLMIVLPDTYLEKVDRATMAASLEVRVPFLDNDLVDFSAPLPGRIKTPRGKKKWLLRTALRGVVPTEVLDGPKTGLEVPYAHWLQTALRPFFFDHFAEFISQYPDVLDAAHVESLYERTRSGVQNHSHMLWKLLNFMIWAKNSRVVFQ